MVAKAIPDPTDQYDYEQLKQAYQKAMDLLDAYLKKDPKRAVIELDNLQKRYDRISKMNTELLRQHNATGPKSPKRVIVELRLEVRRLKSENKYLKQEDYRNRHKIAKAKFILAKIPETVQALDRVKKDIRALGHLRREDVRHLIEYE
jgi:hypothetical protein